MEMFVGRRNEWLKKRVQLDSLSFRFSSSSSLIYCSYIQSKGSWRSLYYNFDHFVIFLNERAYKLRISWSFEFRLLTKQQPCLFSSDMTEWLAVVRGYACGEEQHMCWRSQSLQRQGRSFLGRDRSVHILLT